MDGKTAGRWFWSLQGTGLLPSLGRFLVIWLTSLYRELFSPLCSFELTLRRCVILLSLLTAVPALMAWNHLGLFLDDLLFPQWRDTPVQRALFLVGNARSGTTWLHRVLCESDPESFTSLRTWEILFAVSVTWRVLFHVLFLLDRRLLCGLCLRGLSAAERRLVGHVKIHPIGLFEAEEDEWLLMHVSLCQLMLLPLPVCGDVLNELVLFDFHPSMLSAVRDILSRDDKFGEDSHQRDNEYVESERNRAFHELSLRHRDAMLPLSLRHMVMLWYRQCVQRHLYFHQCVRPRLYRENVLEKPLQFVSKNPVFTLRLSTLQSVFRDARVCVVLRDPAQSVPSMISYIAHCWRVFASPKATEKYPDAQQLSFFCDAHYLFPLLLAPERAVSHCEDDRLGVDGTHQWAFLSYHHARRNLSVEVERLLRRLGLWDKLRENKRDEVILAKLRSDEEQIKNFVSSHHYDLPDCLFGLSGEMLKTKFQVVYQVHGAAFSVKD